MDWHRPERNIGAVPTPRPSAASLVASSLV